MVIGFLRISRNCIIALKKTSKIIVLWFVIKDTASASPPSGLCRYADLSSYKSLLIESLKFIFGAEIIRKIYSLIVAS